MDKQISSGLKITFLLHVVVGLVFGLSFLLIPEIWQKVGFPVQEPVMYRLLGAAILGYATSSWLAYKETAWEKVKIVVQTEIVWTILAAAIMVWALLFAGFPPIGWMNAAIMAAFALAFSIFYFRR